MVCNLALLIVSLQQSLCLTSSRSFLSCLSFTRSPPFPRRIRTSLARFSPLLSGSSEATSRRSFDFGRLCSDEEPTRSLPTTKFRACSVSSRSSSQAVSMISTASLCFKPCLNVCPCAFLNSCPILLILLLACTTIEAPPDHCFTLYFLFV